MARSSPTSISGPRSARPRAQRRDAAPASARLFDSPLEAVAFALMCVVLACAPTQLSTFWPVTHDYWPQSVALLAAIPACLMLALSGSRPARGLRASPLSWCLVGFAACNALSLLAAPYKHDALLEVARLAAALAWFPIARRLIFGEPSLAPAGVLAERARLALAVGSASAGTLWACQVAVREFASSRMAQQASFYNTNLFAFSVAVSLPLIAGAWLLSRRLAPAGLADALGLCALGLGAVGLLISASKGGLLGGACGMLAFGILAWSARREAVSSTWRAKRRVLLPIVIVGALGLGAIGARTVLPRFARAAGSESHSALFRAYTWRATLPMANARPILGHGPGSFPTSFPQFQIAGYARSAHQSWLQIAAESGWPSLAFLLGAIGCGLVNARKYLRDKSRPHRAWAAAGAGGALIAGLAHGMTESGWSILSIAMLLAVSLALLDAPPDRSAEEEEEERRPLNMGWLLAVVPLALGASYGLKSQGAENARELSRAALESGSPNKALRLARAATEDAPLDARAWSNKAQLEQATGDKLGASLSYGEAARLQPGKALYPLRIAQIFDSWSRPDMARQYFDKAIALDPRDTSLRLRRAQFLQKIGDLKGARADLEAIVRSEDEPLGKFPATPEIVNGDFNRARLLLARDAYERGDRQAARDLAERGLREIGATRASNQAHKEMNRVMEMYGEGQQSPGEDELSEQERTFRSLAGK